MTAASRSAVLAAALALGACADPYTGGIDPFLTAALGAGVGAATFGAAGLAAQDRQWHRPFGYGAAWPGASWPGAWPGGGGWYAPPPRLLRSPAYAPYGSPWGGWGWGW